MIGFLRLILTITVMLSVFPAAAQTLVNANDRGWYNNSGQHTPTNNNTYTGQISANVYRSYYRFTIPASFTCVASATLEMELENHYGAPGLHALNLYDITPANVPLLDTANGSGSGVAIFNDMGSGTAYGTETGIASSDVGTVYSFALPAAALTDISSAAGSDFAVGAEAVLGGASGTRGLRFSAGNEARVHRLTLTGCPNVSATKSQIIFDPAAAGLYALPGNDMIYTISIENDGTVAVDNDSVVLIDVMPPEIEFLNADIDTGGPNTFPGTDPVAFVDAGSGLSFTYATDVAFSNSATRPANFAACTYTPSAGYDPAVTYICINPKGTLAAGSSPAPGFSVSFRGRIK